MPRVLITEFMDEQALTGFGADVEVIYSPDLVDDTRQLRTEIAQADALIVRNRTRVSSDLLDVAPNLQVIGRLGVGLENIDLEACAARGIGVFPATGANTQSVVEYVIGTMLTLRRGAFSSTESVASGAWPRGPLGQGAEVSGLTLGLVGFGAIAQAVAVVARALGMQIAAFDPFLPADHPAWADATPCTLDDLLSRSDVVSLHVPFTDETAGLFDAARLAAMKPGACLINTARGGIVDEAALVEALRVGHLGGAALDVFASEPLTAAAGHKFKDCPNLILTPHIAGVTAEANTRVSHITVAQVQAALQSDGTG